MKSANLLIVALLCITTNGISQTEHTTPVSYYPSSGAYSKNFSDAFSIISNPASLSTLNGFNAGVYGERRFMLAETSMYTAIAAMPSTSGNFAMQADYFGYAEYNESQIGLAYGIPVSEKIGIGAKFNYYNLHISSYGNTSAVNFEVGSLIHITEQLHTGVSVYNPLGSSLGKNTGEKLAPVYKAGIGYEMSSSFFTGLEVIKENGKNVNLHVSLQYKPLEQLFARIGMLTAPSSFYFGIGYENRQLRIDISANFHQQLGVSPGLLLLYQFKKSERK
ncbi:MAG TPA: hypothetical protein VFV68_16600 [Agriterribacter sp.]|nr:hypothetical protein [Agriterribacter sp.]